MLQGRTLAVNAFYRLLNVLIVFGTSILLTRLTGVAGYGLLSLLVANATIFGLLSAFGADSGIGYHAAAGTINSGKILFLLVFVVGFQAFILCISEIISYYTVGHLWLLNTTQLHYWWVGLVFLFSVAMMDKYGALLNGRQFFLSFNKIVCLGNFVMLLVFVGFYFTAPAQSAYFYISAFVLLNLLQAFMLVITYHVRSGERFRLQWPLRTDRRLFFSYSLFSFLINIIQFLAYRVDYWLLEYYKNNEQLGWYSLSVKLAQMFWVLPLLFASMILPKVAANAGDEEVGVLVLIRSMNLLNLFSGILLFLVAPYFIPWFFGREFDKSVVLFQVLLPGVILFCMVTVLAAYFAGKKQLRINFAGSIICLVVIGGLDLLLIPTKGMMGAAMASSIGYGITAVYFVTVFCIQKKIAAAHVLIPRREDGIFIKNIFRSLLTKKIS